MHTVRRSEDRGKADFGWLDSRHTFSFGEYYDPQHMGFGPLRVINEDKVAPGAGFGTHGHRDMEIISYVLEGALAHKDSEGNTSVIRPGDIQRMTAGTGVRHSEMNASEDQQVHFLQIWIMPERNGLEPSYEEQSFDTGNLAEGLRLLGSRNGRDGSVKVHQDVALYGARLADGQTVDLSLAQGRGAWVHVVRGKVSAQGEALGAGDALAVRDEDSLTITGSDDAEILVFDLPLNRAH